MDTQLCTVLIVQCTDYKQYQCAMHRKIQHKGQFTSTQHASTVQQTVHVHRFTNHHTILVHIITLHTYMKEPVFF